jgi:hypothetical protein
VGVNEKEGVGDGKGREGGGGRGERWDGSKRREEREEGKL